MCFSATASFAASGMLLPLGLYSLIKAFKTNKRYIPFALIPLIFSVHQFIEGLIWDTIHSHSYNSIYQSILAFTFIAFFIWPTYIPFSIYWIEPQKRRRHVLAGLGICGLILSMLIYAPILLGWVYVDASIVQDSVAYPTDQSPLIQTIYTLCYMLIITLSLFISSLKEIKIFGLLLFFSFLFSVVWFYFAVASRWCFFAALLSTYIVYCMYQLPNQNKRVRKCLS